MSQYTSNKLDFRKLRKVRKVGCLESIVFIETGLVFCVSHSYRMVSESGHHSFHPVVSEVWRLNNGHCLWWPHHLSSPLLSHYVCPSIEISNTLAHLFPKGQALHPLSEATFLRTRDDQATLRSKPPPPAP